MAHGNAEEKVNLPIPFGWFAVARSQDLASGGVQPLYCFDEHLVLYRSMDGKSHVLEAFCPHLGAHLGHGGKVEDDVIVCPFHGWQFDSQGACVKVPYASQIPKRARRGSCLHSYPVRERNGMIWAWSHPRRLAPMWEVDDVPELSDPGWIEAEYHCWEVESSIQETAENAVDIAHFTTVHTAQAMPKARVTVDGHRQETRLTCPIPAIDDNGHIDLPRLEEVQLITTSFGPGFAVQSFTTRLKTVMLSTVTPITANRLKLWFIFTRPRDLSPKFAMLADALNAEVTRQVGQDIPIWENKKYLPTPMLCDGDGPIGKYRRWFSQVYDATAARPARDGQSAIRRKERTVPASRQCDRQYEQLSKEVELHHQVVEEAQHVQ